MNVPIEIATQQRNLGKWVLPVRIAAVIAFCLSSYLLYKSYTGGGLPGCGIESGCGAVLSSRWAYIFGMPVSITALLAYAAIIIGSVFLTKARTADGFGRAEGFMIAAASAVLAAAAWFIVLQLFVIRSICPYCMTAHAFGVVVAGLILFNTFGKSSRQPKPPEVKSLEPAAKILWAALGLAATSLLVMGQLVSAPKTFAVTSSADLAERKAPRILQLHGDIFQLDLGQLPLVGNPSADCVIVHLFDYSCPHCRALHPILMDVVRHLSNQVALVSLPVPLATNCNWLLRRPIAAHVNACAYAYAGLAVWRSDASKLPAFDEWMFAPHLPPSPEAADAKGMELVGTNQFKQALLDPWVKNQIFFDIRLYATNHYRYHKDILPELMIGTNLVSGPVSSTNELYQLIGEQFNISPR